MKDFSDQLHWAIRAKYPILYVVTPEEERAEGAIEWAAQRCHPPRRTRYFDLVRGFTDTGEAKNNVFEALQTVERTDPETPTVFVLCDLHRRLGGPRFDETTVRQLRNLDRHLRATRKTLILLAPVLELPLELEDRVTVLPFPLPDAAEIRELLTQMLPPKCLQLNPEGVEQLVAAGLGLTRDRLRQVLARILVEKEAIRETDIATVLQAKQQRIRQTEYLEFFAPALGLTAIGGMGALKQWLQQRQRAFTAEAREYGLPHPKGVLLLGIQGTGKSLCAKAIAHLWRLPLLRLDVGRLFGSLVGQSENRTRQVTQLAETIAPCVLWIDEIDKAFAGSSGFSTDSGTSQRVTGTLLTWMQEKTAPVFVVATANNLTALPPELLRKGRFDEIFFIDLPNAEERAEIFRVHLEQLRPHRLREFDVVALAAATPSFSGAEIEQAVIEGMYRAFGDRRDVTTEDILAAVQGTYPLASTAREQIQALQTWAAQGRARSASSFSEMPGFHS
ncbi:MAG TPA: AAA family ATPase [Cyanobacteria bacterium UBA8156]|nr:AAA family ATPase [Cyanobacteria bacterium UBA8156]